MCAVYTIRISASDLQASFDSIRTLISQFNDRILPYKKAPILFQEGPQQIFKLMNFSLIPSWSKDPKVKWATHNARMETLLEKATWKKLVARNRCLVPISTFIEPIYTGPLAGNMVSFTDQREKLLLAAGLHDSWTNKETGEVIDSFAIITSDPPKFIGDTGHDRCPVFLTKSAYRAWIEVNRDDTDDFCMDILQSSRKDFDFKAEVDRPMAAGWKKRIPKN